MDVSYWSLKPKTKHHNLFSSFLFSPCGSKELSPRGFLYLLRVTVHLHKHLIRFLLLLMHYSDSLLMTDNWPANIFSEKGLVIGFYECSSFHTQCRNED